MAKLSCLAFCLILLLCGGALAFPGRPAYVLKFTSHNIYLDAFDTETDSAFASVRFPAGYEYNNFVVDEKGGCYLARYHLSGSYLGSEIHYYDPSRKKIERFVDLGDAFGPRYMVLTKELLVVEVNGNNRSRVNSGLIFVDRQTGKIAKTIYLQEGNKYYGQANINDLSFDGERYLLLSSFYLDKIDPNGYGYGDIYIVDITSKEIVKIIEVPREYTYTDGVYKIGDKIYLAALAIGKRASSGSSPSNTDLLVFSFSSGKLIKKIPVSPHPFKLAYDPSVGKLYVQHMDDGKMRADFEIINTLTDQVIGKLTIPGSLMSSVVRPGKMYVTVGDMLWLKSPVKAVLVVVDTKTDKIIKRIPGQYKGISEKSFVE
jgi:DNA-binding beta-propeller fold protein YncE